MNLTKTTGVFMSYLDTLLAVRPTTVEDLEPNTPNPQLIIELNKRLNEQSGRIRNLIDTVGTVEQAITFTAIMHWRERARYLRSVGQAKRAAALEKAEALKEAKAADQDDEFMEGYKQFLATEFDA